MPNKLNQYFRCAFFLLLLFFPSHSCSEFEAFRIGVSHTETHSNTNEWSCLAPTLAAVWTIYFYICFFFFFFFSAMFFFNFMSPFSISLLHNRLRINDNFLIRNTKKCEKRKKNEFKETQKKISWKVAPKKPRIRDVYQRYNEVLCVRERERDRQRFCLCEAHQIVMQPLRTHVCAWEHESCTNMKYGSVSYIYFIVVYCWCYCYSPI